MTTADSLWLWIKTEERMQDKSEDELPLGTVFEKIGSLFTFFLNQRVRGVSIVVGFLPGGEEVC